MAECKLYEISCHHTVESPTLEGEVLIMCNGGLTFAEMRQVDAIVLPCKPGSTVYEIERYPNDDFCGECPSYSPPFPGDPASCLNDDGYHRCVECMTISETVATIDQILHWIEFNLVGEFVFLTREEAEAALRKMDKEDL